MKRERNSLYVISICLALATIIAYEPVRHNDFVGYDDNIYVTENPQVLGGLTRESVIWALTTSYAGNWHPLTSLSHMLDCQLFGLNPFWHHLVNLLFHTANTLLLFWALQRMTGAVWASAFVAAAFALHPLHVESVAWVSERKDVLSGFFWILTMIAYVWYVERPNIRRYLLVFLVFVLGLMAKPMLVTLPFVLLLLDYWPLGRFQDSQDVKAIRWPNVYHLIWEKVPFFALSVVSSVVTFITQQSGISVTLPLSFRIANALLSYVNYINKMFYPVSLAVFYPYHDTGLSLEIVHFIELAVVSAIIIYTSRRYRYLAVGWFWYLGTLVPVIGLVQVGLQAMADRYTYLPSIGIFIMVGWGVSEVVARWRYRETVLRICAGVVLAAFLICTRLQVRHWQNSSTLYEHTLAVTENNYIMHYNLGNTLRLQGKFDEAISHYHEALQAEPCRSYYAKVHNNLGLTLMMTGRLDDAIEHFNEALRVEPDWPNVHTLLGLAYEQLGKYDLAITHWTKTLKLRPDSAGALNNLARILATTKDPKFQNPTDAVKFAERACELTEYNRPDFLDTLAVAYAAAGDFSEAIKTAEKALELAQSSEQKELTEEIQNHLLLYKVSQPYREPPASRGNVEP